MEDVNLICESKTAIDSNAIDHHVELLSFITVTWVGHIRIPQRLSGFLWNYKDVSLLENIAHVVSEETMHLVIHNIDETHLGQTLQDDLIIAKVGHL